MPAPDPWRLRDLTTTIRKGASSPLISTDPALIDGNRGGEPPGPTDPASLNQAANAIDPASWQATLGAEFDLAETFDHIQDWRGGFGSSVDPAMMPKLTTGATTDVWQRYTNDRISVAVDNISGFQPAYEGGEWVAFGNGARAELWNTYSHSDGRDYLQVDKVDGEIVVGDTVVGETSGATANTTFLPNWIQDFGENTFHGGKSARINYNDYSNGPDGFGPSRLEVFLGNGQTGKSGYQKIHIFFMAKFPMGFFYKQPDDDFGLVGTIKFIEIETGFTAVDYNGTPSEHAQLNQKAKFTRDYGTNLTFINIKGGGSSTPQALFFHEQRFCTKMETGGYGYERVENNRIGTTSGGPGDWSSMYNNEEWVGLEFILDCGTVDNFDGTSTELYIYDADGVEKHHIEPSQNEECVRVFDHRYNKLVLGGNRLCNGYGSCEPGLISWFYVDDFIVHSDRIAPTYFQKLAERLGS